MDFKTVTYTMITTHSKATLLVGIDPDTLTQDCRLLRENTRTGLASADEVIDFLDGYNSFVNHATRPFSPMREVNMLL